MKWYSFNDMHSGGGRKAQFELYVVEADCEPNAVTTFRNETGRDPDHITCECCGEDYAIVEWDSWDQLAEAMDSELDRAAVLPAKK